MNEGKVMTPQEFKTFMEQLKNRDDPEMAHFEADILMCELLSALGYSEGVQVFEKMTKWYA